MLGNLDCQTFTLEFFLSYYTVLSFVAFYYLLVEFLGMILIEILPTIRAILNLQKNYLCFCKPARETVGMEDVVAICDSDFVCGFDRAETDNAIFCWNEIHVGIIFQLLSNPKNRSLNNRKESFNIFLPECFACGLGSVSSSSWIYPGHIPPPPH